MQSKPYGVLIADVVASSQQTGLRASLDERLGAASGAHLGAGLVRLPYAVTAGDEFQSLAVRVGAIPRMILDLRRRFQPLQLRIGVGIGAVQGPVRAPVNRLAGQAFEFARQAVTDTREARKYPVLTLFRSKAAEFDETANLVYGLHDTLVSGTTAKQWATIAAYLDQNRVDYTARAMGIDRSTASRNLKRGHFWQMVETATIMERLLERSFR